MALTFESNFSICSILSEAAEQQDQMMRAPSGVSASTSMPPSSSSSSVKPAYALNSLIHMAICSCPGPNKRLLLGEIRQWIMTNFPFYGEVNSTWKNSLRHTLTVNSYFMKVPREADDPGRGNYWKLHESAKNLIVDESTGRLRQNIGLNAARPIPSQDSGHFGVHYPVQQHYDIESGIQVPQYYSQNSVYFGTPEETWLAQHDLMQRYQLEQQIWMSFHLQQQPPLPLQPPLCIPLQHAMHYPSHHVVPQHWQHYQQQHPYQQSS